MPAAAVRTSAKEGRTELLCSPVSALALGHRLSHRLSDRSVVAWLQQSGDPLLRTIACQVRGPIAGTGIVARYRNYYMTIPDRAAASGNV